MRPFVALQVAFGLVVLFVGSLLVLSFARLSSVNPGFATSDVLLLSVEHGRSGVDANQQRAALLQVLDRLRDVPGVEAVSSAEFNVLGRAWTYNSRGARDAARADRDHHVAGHAGLLRNDEDSGAGRPRVRRRDIGRRIRRRPSWSTRPSPRATSVATPAVGRMLEGRFG